MQKWSSAWKHEEHLIIKPAYPHYTKVYKDHRLYCEIHGDQEVTLPIKENDTVLTIVGFYDNWIVREDFNLFDQNVMRNQDYQPGDILVASDNIKQELSGYVGHTALVVDGQQLVEATGGHPAIVKDSIKQFKEKHPIHAQFRPKNKELGEKAAAFAKEYYSKYKENLSNDIKKPEFSFQLSQDLKDIWDYIYCSKLVWISYHYGANYTFENDYLWFSPEDLYNQLIENEKFELVYKHPEVKFIINT
ncbi:hypothetical protein SAMN04487944_102209 [Gracilibacillus ureilyticus]|uniref:Permuted papain-like amidase enzyme, YaeF/YiiX, C92 family n=1 Tax=Gracilibacillus ureilyticus TaxID=531814 RepID=A0A1H9MWR3_9BACI|nr:hypothetical protein [Gracilibacillus ureilyticus]SER28160.1 hypothetical protein SAMN04487944_102209 [Gracilibacillus ureilyticus]